MFTRADGPTALRADLVRTLAFSVSAEAIESAAGPERAVAGVASVWNGRKGFLCLVVRFLENPRVERYVYSEALSSPDDMTIAEEEAYGFLQAMGFLMDAPEWGALDDAAQQDRLDQWNRMRKVRKPASKKTKNTAPVPVTPRDPEPAPPPPAAAAAEGPGDRAVLGKLELVRRQEGGTPHLHPLGRLLSFF